MRNLKLQIEYDGTNYAGWQTQQTTPHARRKRPTIQQTIVRVLQKILRERVELIVSGRTDAGVHALAQVASFKTDSSLPAEKIRQALNALLPQDIAISGIEEVPLNFHPLRAAKSKIYRYSILNRQYKPALLKNQVYFCPFPLDLNLMRRAARVLVGRHDFKAFCATGSSARSTVRTVKKLNIEKRPPDLIIIEIEAVGFLYKMARNIVGTLIEVGRGRLLPGALRSILLSEDRRRAGPTAPAQGLCLVRVRY
jgi:tRNA pseudouridine38-40 synthase